MRVVSVFAAALWLAMVVAGFGWLATYETRPGRMGDVSQSWPEASRLERDSRRWNLVMFLHPRCPCSAASLEELGELTAAHASELRACVVFCKPQGVPAKWEQTATWTQAATLAGIVRTSDENDGERRAFGALTSGEVFLYDPSGRLRYRGGITSARGKAGPSEGREVIESLLTGEEPARREGPVFGCPLTSG
jgi:hypothetical protein